MAEPTRPVDPELPEGADTLAVFASARLVDTSASVGALRFDPDDAGRPLGDGRTLSGWSVFVGGETEEELEDADRVRIPSLSWLIERDPAVTQVISGHDATLGFWVRHDDAGAPGPPTWERLLP